MKYALVDIGCIECGEGTDVIGVYDTEELAESALQLRIEKVGANRFGDYFTGGQRRIEVLEVEDATN